MLKLGLADVHDLHNLLHKLQARIHNSSEAERPAKKSRDNTGAGTAQPQDDTQTNEILHRALGNLGAVVQAHQPPSSHAARTGGQYTWGRDARRPAGKGGPLYPSSLPVCSSARRRHSGQHSGGRGHTDGRGQPGQCTGQRHMKQHGSPWAWCILLLLLSPVLVCLSGGAAVGTAHSHPAARRRLQPVLTLAASIASRTQLSILHAEATRCKTDVVEARLPHTAPSILKHRQAQLQAIGWSERHGRRRMVKTRFSTPSGTLCWRDKPHARGWRGPGPPPQT